MKQSYWIVLVIVILAGLAWYWYGMQKPEAESLVTDDNAVLVSDQQPGDETTVTYAKLSQPGYVVVYESDASGNKTVLGSSDLLAAGEHRNVRVRHGGSQSVSGTTISAAIVVDDGDGEFSEETDTEVVAEDDATIDAEAVLDVDVTDEELVELLEDAGYLLTDDTENAEAMEESGDAETEVEVDTEVDAMIETEGLMEGEESTTQEEEV